MIDDDDTSSFNEVNNSKPYDDFEIIKEECVGHVQKRLGTRLRTLQKSLKGKNLSDRKKTSTRGRLTDKVINSIQNIMAWQYTKTVMIC